VTEPLGAAGSAARIPNHHLLYHWLPGLAAARRRIQRRGWRVWLHRERQPVVDTLKITMAATLAWVIMSVTLPHHNPLLAPLTALLTVQVTASATLLRGAQQVAGVIIGVLAAFGLTHALGFHAWSLGLTIFGSLLLGRALKLGTQSTGIATTGLLVLSLGSKGNAYAGDRLLTTLIGAAVGIFITLITPSRRDLIAAGVALAGVADDTGDLLTDMSKGLRAGDGARPSVAVWLHRARNLNNELVTEQQLRHTAADGARLAPKLFSDPARLEQFTHAGKVVSHTVDHVQTLAAALREWSDLASHTPTPTLTGWLAGPVAELLESLGSAAACFGLVQRLPRDRAQPVVDELRATIVTARALQVDVGIVAEITDRRAWPIEGAVLEATGAVIAELDPDNGRHAGACPFAAVSEGPDSDLCA
jgi:hypothetical protein